MGRAAVSIGYVRLGQDRISRAMCYGNVAEKRAIKYVRNRIKGQ